MKKIVLIMMFCLGLVGLNSELYAQATPGAAAEQYVGSYHGFQVASHTGNHYEWTVLELDKTSDFDAVGTSAAGKFNFYTYNSGGASIAEKFTGTAAGTFEGTDKNAVGIQWLSVNEEGKVFAIEVAEFNGADGSCSTRRRYFVEVTASGIDFMIAALNPGDNTEFTATPTVENLTRCNTFSGSILANSYVDDAAKNTALGKTSVYYKIEMKTGTQAWNGAWGFDYALTNSNGTGLSIEVLDAVAGNSVGSADLTNSKISVEEENSVAYLKVSFLNVLGTKADADIVFNLSEKNAAVTSGNTTAYISTGSNQFEVSNEAANNKVVANFVINASPNTSEFTVD